MLKNCIGYHNNWFDDSSQIPMKMTFISRHLMRRPNNSIGYLEELKIRSKTELKTKDILQVGISDIHYPKTS